MATITKLKAEVNNKNLPILGNDGNLYSFYYGNFYNTIVSKGYTPTIQEKEALESFINRGITDGWLDTVKYFLPLIGNSEHLNAATVPLIDTVGNYAMTEYDGNENFDNSFEIANGKVRYYRRLNNTNCDCIKTPLTISDMNQGICFSGYMPYPELSQDSTLHNRMYCGIFEGNKAYFMIRQQETLLNSVIHHLGYSIDYAQTDTVKFPLAYPNSNQMIEYSVNFTKLIVNYGMYKENGVVKRLRNFLAANGNTNFLNGLPDSEITYPDYSNVTNKMTFSDIGGVKSIELKFGCLAVLDAPKITNSLINSYNSAVFDLMTSLGR